MNYEKVIKFKDGEELLRGMRAEMLMEVRSLKDKIASITNVLEKSQSSEPTQNLKNFVGKFNDLFQFDNNDGLLLDSTKLVSYEEWINEPLTKKILKQYSGFEVNAVLSNMQSTDVEPQMEIKQRLFILFQICFRAYLKIVKLLNLQVDCRYLKIGKVDDFVLG